MITAEDLARAALQGFFDDSTMLIRELDTGTLVLMLNV